MKKERVSQEEKWNRRYMELVAFYQANGHTDIPIKYEENRSLGAWVNVQRRYHKQGILKTERYQRLNELGFNWGINFREKQDELNWEENFKQLKAFGKEYGEINFAVLNKKHPYYNLSVWCNNQRIGYRLGRLSVERQQELESIGFLWELRQKKYKGQVDRTRPTVIYKLNQQWIKSYESYLKYRQDNNNDTSRLRKENPRLYDWRKRQIQKGTKGTLTIEKQELLKEAGFNFNLTV